MSAAGGSGMPLLLKRALGAAAMLTALVASARAEPALFVARDADTTVYLFGTIHAALCDAPVTPVPPGKRPAVAPCVDWMSDTVEAALAGADELWIETADVTDAALLLGLVQDLGYLPDGVHLTDFMPEAELRTLAAMGGPTVEAILPQLDTMQPWMLSTVLGVAGLVDGGGSPQKGVDLTLVGLAAKLGIPLRGFETAEFQVRLLAGDPLPLQVADLRASAVLLNHDIDIAAFSQWSFGKLWHFWLDGDLDSVAAMSLGTEDFFEQYDNELSKILGVHKAEIEAIDRETDALYEAFGDPVERGRAAYERIYAERNHSWIAPINALLARPGTFFVAVGAGHLSGDAAVQVLLEQEGVVVTRVE